MFPWIFQHAYKTVGDDDYESDETFKTSQFRRSRNSNQAWKILTIFSWVMTVVFATLAMLQYSERVHMSNLLESSSHSGRETEFSSARSHISEGIVRFSGSPAVMDNGTIYVPHPDPITYNGFGPEVDQAWEELTGGRYILITDEEARDTFGDNYTEYWDPKVGGYLAGFDVFHTLHCLNNVRKMTPEDLQLIQTSVPHREHYHHCLSQIRQLLMCSADMTPVPTKYYPGLGRNYHSTDYPHTCRNFQEIRSWLWERYNGSLAVSPRFTPMKVD